jgi:hypothetical protein
MNNLNKSDDIHELFGGNREFLTQIFASSHINHCRIILFGLLQYLFAFLLVLSVISMTVAIPHFNGLAYKLAVSKVVAVST